MILTIYNATVKYINFSYDQIRFYNFDQSRSKIVPYSNFCFLSATTFLLAKQEGFTLVLSQFENFLTKTNDKCNERRKSGFSRNHQIVTSSLLSHTPSFIF